MANWLMICSDAAGAAIPVSVTRYNTVSGLLPGGATEANNRTNVKESYTWSSLWCRVTANAATTNACTVRSRIDAGNGNLVISIAAGTTGAFAEASPSSDSLIADQLIDYSIANADATGTVTFTIVSSILAGTNPILIGRGGTPAAGATTYPAIAGGGGSAGTEATTAYAFRTATTLSGLHVICTLNTVLAASTVYCRIAGASGNQTVSIPASTTGIYDDAVNTDAVTVGQTVNNIITAGAGGTSITINTITYRSTSVVMQEVNQTGNAATSNFGTTYFLILNGHPQRNNTTEANEQTLARMNFTARNLFVRFNTNTVNGTSTVVTRKSGADGNLTVSIPASTSGNYEDTTHSDFVLSTDTYNYSVALGGTSGTTYITACNLEQVGEYYIPYPSYYLKILAH
jgi:hypothetical protein